MKFTLDYTNMIARQLGYRGNLHEFWLGMNFESENGNANSGIDNKPTNPFLTTKNPRTSIILSDDTLSAKLALANLNKKPHYYSQLLKMEGK